MVANLGDDVSVGVEALVPVEGGAAQTIQLLEEVLQVAKRTVETGRVRVSVSTESEQRTVHETLQSRRISVDRIPVGRRLGVGEAMPQPRTEDGVLIVPLVEEILVVEKRLVITEELHIRTVQEQHAVEEVVALRRQTAKVDHFPPPEPASLP